MTPAEFQSLAEAFRREESRLEYTFEVRADGSGFMTNVRRGGEPVAVVGGVLMPTGDVHPWVVTAANAKSFLEVVPFERSRDLVRRLIVSVERGAPPADSAVVLGTEHAESCRCPACDDEPVPPTVH